MKENWNDMLARAKASGLSDAEFCRQNNVKIAKFSYYKAKSRVASTSEVVAFGKSGSLKVEVAGLSLEFSSLPDPAWLKALAAKK